MDDNIGIVVIGAGSIGSNFIKEFARFMASYKEGKNMIQLLVLDNANVSEEDIITQYYIERDIGFSKAGVMVGAIRDSYPTIGVRGIRGAMFDVRNGIKLVKMIKSIFYEGNKKVDFLYLIDTVNSSCTNKAMVYCSTCFPNNIVLRVFSRQVGGRIDITAYFHHMNVICNNSNEVATSDNEPVVCVPISLNFLNSLMCSQQLISYLCNCLVNKKLELSNIYYDSSLYNTSLRRMDIVLNTKKLDKEVPEHVVVACLGAGGTGGNFAKEFVRLLPYYKKKKNIPSISFLLIDGDSVEEKNKDRQPFLSEDVQKNKAVTLVDTFKECLSLEEDVYAYPHYIDNIFQLRDVISLGFKQDKKNKVYLIGCVDNHRARQVMEEYFRECSDVIYVDSANEFSNGEVVVGVKEDKKVISPPRSYYYPDVLTDKGASASELSCGEINISSPQHLVTNLIAARNILSVVIRSIEFRCTDRGIIYFDGFSYFSRFQPYLEEVL